MSQCGGSVIPLTTLNEDLLDLIETELLQFAILCGLISTIHLIKISVLSCDVLYASIGQSKLLVITCFDLR